MHLQKIAEEKWVKFICDGFKSTGKKIAESLARQIPLTMKNHSWYVQQLAHYTWNTTQKTAGKPELVTALRELLSANSPLYQKEIENMATGQLNLLKAILSGETQFTSAPVMQDYRLGTPNNVSKNKTSLVNNDIIQDVNGSFEFVDPAFELWFRKQYFGEAYGLGQK